MKRCCAHDIDIGRLIQASEQRVREFFAARERTESRDERMSERTRRIREQQRTPTDSTAPLVVMTCPSLNRSAR